MPKKKHSAKHESSDEYIADDSEEPDLSDAEDFVAVFGGLTIPQAKSGTKRLNFPLHMRTTMFGHAIIQQYCSKNPPTVDQFIHLLRLINPPMAGLRVSETFITGIASWISNNVSQQSLAGFLVEKINGKLGTVYTYDISISKALVNAVMDPNTFSYNDILQLHDPSSAIGQQHAILNRQMVPFGAPSGQRPPSMGDVVKATISHLAGAGCIVPSSRVAATVGNQGVVPPGTSPASMPMMSSYWHPAVPPTAGASYPSAAAAGSSLMSAPAQSPYGPAAPIWDADKVRASQNENAYAIFRDKLTQEVERAQESGAADPPDSVRDNMVWNGGDFEYHSENDYVGW
ncbi:hypothetical protein AC578_7763 [Pseudocercospora eumusae]|uniref:Uncharacterized protein n=1 Tax=Pseudocercospora eumusae TaxID=321146 RepID=A0A139H0Z0_9PEZI|nr:hypothetical protein AC578_7763 [Pseudocercospora eumusae]